MIQLILKDVKSLRLDQNEKVYAGENKISEFSVVLPERITQYKTAECVIEMRSFVSEDRYISTQIDTSTRNPKVPITSELTEKAQIVPIMFFITHEGNVIGKTNFEKLNVLESKDGSTPLDPREELDEIIAELREQNAAQAQTISSQAATIEQQSSRITELNSEVADLSADNELLRDTVDTFNKSEPKLETPDIVTPSGETQLITPNTSKGYVGLKSVTIDRVTAAADPNIQPENIKEGVEILSVEGTYKPLGGEGGIYVDEWSEFGYPKDITIKNWDGHNEEFNIPSIADKSWFVSRLEKLKFIECKNILLNDFNKFESCSRLEELRLEGVTKIGSTAFRGCNSLTELTISDSVTYIDSYAFYGCISLTSLTISNSVINIGVDAFYGCHALTELILAQGFNCNNLKVSQATLLSVETLVAMLEALADRTGQTAYTLTIGTTNLNKMTAEEKAIATNKNWNLV